MVIIPVIDLMHNQVVHAKFGQRHQYQPIQSALSNSSNPEEVIQALLELYPFNILYIADIDAIQGNGGHFELITSLAQQRPDVTFWLDCGIRQMNHRALHYQQNIRPVVGSECMDNLVSYKAVSYACASQHVLSLDFSQSTPLGTVELHASAKYWPDDVICMSLNYVGSGQGVDTAQLQHLAALNSARKTPSKLYAAGGVKDIQDCFQLKKLNVAGVLVASALHNQSISSTDIVALYDSDRQ